MRSLRSRLHLRCAAILGAAGLAAAGAAAQSVTVTLPLSVGFQVTDVGRATVGNPDPSRIEFSNASLAPGDVLRIGVEADAPSFTPPSGAAIPASGVSWTTANAVGCTGVSGSLSYGVSTTVLESVDPATAGSLEVTWTLAAPGGGIRAGDHDLVLRWRVESVLP